MELTSSSDCLARLVKAEFCYGLSFQPFTLPTQRGAPYNFHREVDGKETGSFFILVGFILVCIGGVSAQLKNVR